MKTPFWLAVAGHELQPIKPSPHSLPPLALVRTIAIDTIAIHAVTVKHIASAIKVVTLLPAPLVIDEPHQKKDATRNQTGTPFQHQPLHQQDSPGDRQQQNQRQTHEEQSASPFLTKVFACRGDRKPNRANCARHTVTQNILKQTLRQSCYNQWKIRRSCCSYPLCRTHLICQLSSHPFVLTIIGHTDERNAVAPTSVTHHWGLGAFSLSLLPQFIINRRQSVCQYDFVYRHDISSFDFAVLVTNYL